jgi:hypothetical protein
MKRKGDGVETCRKCGSPNLWGTHVNRRGEYDPFGVFRLLCEDCGAMN